MIGTPIRHAVDPRETATRPKKRTPVKKKPKTGEEVVVNNHLALFLMEDMPYDQQTYPQGTPPPSQTPSETRPESLEALLAELPDLGEEEEEVKQPENTLPVYEGWAPGEYPQGIPPSPPPSSSPTGGIVVTCPIHEFPLHHNVSQRGWAYVQCLEEGCPFWCAEEDAISLTMEWRLQVCDDVKDGPFTCLCDKPYKIVLCRNSARGNRGRLFLTCKQTPQCRFFQWADTPRDRKAIRAHHEVNGNTYSRETTERRKRASFRYAPRPPPKRARYDPLAEGRRRIALSYWVDRDCVNCDGSFSPD